MAELAILAEGRGCEAAAEAVFDFAEKGGEVERIEEAREELTLQAIELRGDRKATVTYPSGRTAPLRKQGTEWLVDGSSSPPKGRNR